MKNTLSILILLAFMSSYGNKIDLLNTTQEVIDFVREIHPDFDNPRFTIRSTEQMAQDLHCDGIFNEWNIKNWEKADLTHNGKTDLIFIAYFNGYKPYAIIDLGNDTYNLLSLTKSSSFKDCTLIKPIQIDGKTYLKHHHLAQVLDRENKNRIRYQTISIVDTLTVKYGAILEFNDKKTQYAIEKVTLETMPCFGICPVFDLTIDKNGHAQFTGKTHVSKKGDFTTRFPLQTVEELWAMIAYAQIKELGDEFESSWSDGQTLTLHVDFSDGTTKKIRDYGLQGTFGLRAIYDKLLELGTETDWK